MISCQIKFDHGSNVEMFGHIRHEDLLVHRTKRSLDNNEVEENKPKTKIRKSRSSASHMYLSDVKKADENVRLRGDKHEEDEPEEEEPENEGPEEKEQKKDVPEEEEHDEDEEIDEEEIDEEIEEEPEKDNPEDASSDTELKEEHDSKVRKAPNQQEFLDGVKLELRSTSNIYVISDVTDVTAYKELGPSQKGEVPGNLRPLDSPVKRWEHREKISQNDPDGCGYPICVRMDARPTRFTSLCNFTAFLLNKNLVKQLFHIQKGDCADAIEGRGHDFPWGKKAKDDCNRCYKTDFCQQTLCVASPEDNKARTFESVCRTMEYIHDQRQVITLHVGLGKCKDLLNPNVGLYTEWFDIDEPCMEGDTESAAQNLALAASYEKTGRFRMCPTIYRKGEPEFLTVEGQNIPDGQIVHKDLKNHKLACLNKDQVNKPGPPNMWFHRKIKCRDYKIRHICVCLYGCYPPDSGGSQETWKLSNKQYGGGHDGAIRVDLPQVKTLFDECRWQPFISNEYPQPDTWDGEDRASAIKNKLGKHVCGSKPFSAMYIDARRRSDDIPWDETGEIITKNTPLYGFLCINKNNHPFKKLCSDYKVRYCCLKDKQPQWGPWSPWSDCTKTCGGGQKGRERICEDKRGSKNTCFGNWIDKDDHGKDRNLHLKMQTAPCSEISCPDDANFMEWMAWEACPTTCGEARRRRRRGCNPPRHGGKECPRERKYYEQFSDCNNPPCADPMWTAWSPWSKCSLTCGVGHKRRTRKCEDLITRTPMIPGLDCLGGSTEMEEDCKLRDCPINGAWTGWQAWSSCSVLCGDNGFRTHKRYCANPLPQFGGKKCPGHDEEKGPCENLMPCPVHCEWSFWGGWTPCSVTCGPIGAGSQERYRHKAIEAKYGGRKCSGTTKEQRACYHQKMAEVQEKKITPVIYFCPVDCIWADWNPWSPCPDCMGELSGIWKEDLPDYSQTRHRRVRKPHRYRGKPCKVKGRLTRVHNEERVGECTRENVPPCPHMESQPYFSQWEMWGTCVGRCGKRGVMIRRRDCLNGDDCSGEPEESRPCPNHCPPVGWSKWEDWTPCPVTCGTAQQTRVRYCRDDTKEERKKNSSCRGTGKEKRVCDVGKCGSHLQWRTAGSDPLEELRKKAKRGQSDSPKPEEAEPPPPQVSKEIKSNVIETGKIKETDTHREAYRGNKSKKKQKKKMKKTVYMRKRKRKSAKQTSAEAVMEADDQSSVQVEVFKNPTVYGDNDTSTQKSTGGGEEDISISIDSQSVEIEASSKPEKRELDFSDYVE